MFQLSGFYYNKNKNPETPKVDLEAGRMSLSMRQQGSLGAEALELQGWGLGAYPAQHQTAYLFSIATFLYRAPER